MLYFFAGVFSSRSGLNEMKWNHWHLCYIFLQVFLVIDLALNTKFRKRRASRKKNYSVYYFSIFKYFRNVMKTGSHVQLWGLKSLHIAHNLEPNSYEFNKWCTQSINEYKLLIMLATAEWIIASTGGNFLRYQPKQEFLYYVCMSWTP